MPGFDGTGPNGAGAFTGGGRGFCALPAERVVGRPFAGRFFGRGGGRGRGRGWMRWFGNAGVPGGVAQGLMPEEEIGVLKGQAEFLRQQLDDVQGRIGTLEKAKENE